MVLTGSGIQKSGMTVEFISEISKLPVQTIKKMAKEMGSVLDYPKECLR